MYKWMIILLIIALPLSAQITNSELKTDSLTYNYYLYGNWEKLIEAGKEAEQNKVNFKHLQQRLGYANFMLGNNYKTIKHYLQALKFDADDPISHTYLYYAAINIGDTDMAMYHATKLTPEMRTFLKLKSFVPFDAIDFEYNYKKNGALSDPALTISDLRSNPNYKRIGLNSKPSFRFNIYQSFSNYKQISNLTTEIHQNEYFLMLSYNIFSRTTLQVGYHYVNTKLEYYMYANNDILSSNIFTGNLSQRLGRLDLSISNSLLTGDTLQSQTGAHVGILLPGRLKPYLKSSVYNIYQNYSNRMVYTQSAGIMANKKLWLEAEVAIGNLDNFVDNNGLYLYNSIDPTKFRTGFSAFWYALPKLTLFTNYTFDKKHLLSNQTNYNQHSFSGGFIWKL